MKTEFEKLTEPLQKYLKERQKIGTTIVISQDNAFELSGVILNPTTTCPQDQ